MADQATHTRKVPEAYDRNAPTFDGEKTSDLLEFLDHMERMMELAGTPDDQKNAFIVRYTKRRVTNQWKSLRSYSGGYEAFKKELIKNYPSAQEDNIGSVRQLEKILREYQPEEVHFEDYEDVMNLIRELNVEVPKLKKHGPVKAETQEATRMLEEIKLSLVNMKDRMDVSDKNHKEDLNQLTQLYKSLSKGSSGPPALGSGPPPRQEVRFRMPGSDLCHYCRTTGHYIGECPVRRKHIHESKIKVVGQRDFFPDGTAIPMGGMKPRSQIVEERAGAAQVNYMSALNQNEYREPTPEEWAAMEAAMEAECYEDYTSYDPRDDEIRSLQIANQNYQVAAQNEVMRQMIQHRQILQRGVPPPVSQMMAPAPAPPTTVAPVDSNLVASLMAVLQNHAGGNENHPVEAQMAVGTRANPSRTGNGQSGF
ncbi:hypothetical protein FB45DRAFT_743028 [Roridomyces roridus]|uniref:CCHC-type domain-containing protein n=1 Tax=Roridomyces roridus TaxID=1738132 RepID=A0AAD7C042_9AGAR|nr:hypothetical protein FB45DRAFT_743028 [Roridomyces roridus]